MPDIPYPPSVSQHSDVIWNYNGYLSVHSGKSILIDNANQDREKVR